MPITSIPIPSSVSPITTLKDFIDKGREDMLSFLAAIKGTYIYWTVFPTNDPLTLKQAEEERRVAEMVDQIDCARIDLALDSINGGSFLPSAINRAPQQRTPARGMDGAELFAGTQSEAEDEWHEPDPDGNVERSMTAQKSTLASTSSAAKGKWGNKDIQNALLAWILKACDDSRHYFHDIANRRGSPNVGKEALLRLCNIIAPPDGMHLQKVPSPGPRSPFPSTELFVTLHTRLKQEEAERRLQCIFTPVCSTVSRAWCSQVLITHSVSKTKRKEVLIGARGCVMHTALSELFLFMCRSASASSRSA